jgi:hypothetical protein
MLAQKLLSIFFIFLFTETIVVSQIIINEVVSSNSEFLDCDGDSPDWIELYNTTNEDIVLDNWALTDDENEIGKWKFENTVIKGGQYLLVWASGKDRKLIQKPRTLINEGEVWRYIIPDSTTSNLWIEEGFDDSLWQEDISGFGFGDEDDATIIPDSSASIYLRKNFSISDISQMSSAILSVDFDDSFVAYINGKEVARENLDSPMPAYDASATRDIEARMYRNKSPKQFDIHKSKFVIGQNTIAIQAHNFHSDSIDLTIIPFLSGYFNPDNEEGIPSPEILKISEISPHTNFKISSDETIFLYNENEQEVSSFAVGESPTNVSFGRRSSDQNIVLFDPPTPRRENLGNGFEGFVNRNIDFSNDGGQVDSFQLTLTVVDSTNIIRYTLDSTIPNDTSLVYSQPISIDTNTVVRARVFKDGFEHLKQNHAHIY